MAGGLKPPPSRGEAHGNTPYVGEGTCVWCGGHVWRRLSRQRWRTRSGGSPDCPVSPTKEHDLSKAPDLQDPAAVEKWLSS